MIWTCAQVGAFAVFMGEGLRHCLVQGDLHGPEGLEGRVVREILCRSLQRVGHRDRAANTNRYTYLGWRCSRTAMRPWSPVCQIRVMADVLKY